MGFHSWLLIFITICYLMQILADETEDENDFLIPVKSDVSQKVLSWTRVTQKYYLTKKIMKYYEMINYNPRTEHGVMLTPYEVMAHRDEDNRKSGKKPETASWYNNYVGSIFPEVILIMCIPIAVGRVIQLFWRSLKPEIKYHYGRDMPYIHVPLAEIQHTAMEKRVRYEDRKSLNWLARYVKLELKDNSIDLAELYHDGLENKEYFKFAGKNTEGKDKWTMLQPVKTMQEIYRVAEALEKHKINEIDPRVRARWHKMEKKKDPNYQPPIPKRVATFKERVDYHMYEKTANPAWMWRKRNLLPRRASDVGSVDSDDSGEEIEIEKK